MELFLKLFEETLELTPGVLKQKTKFRDLPEWDSLSVLSILAMINSEFDITFSRKEFSSLNTIKQVYDFVMQKSGEKNE